MYYIKKSIGKEKYQCPHCNEEVVPLNFQNKPVTKMEKGYRYINAALLGCPNCHKVFWEYEGYKLLKS